ncbi:MAG: hypothetical protein H8D69_00300 [Chloroflexi bacterium]|nr:hypothetical protein [Chloroflexota bacterium]
MESSKTASLKQRLAPALTILLLAFLITATGCGSGETDDESFPKISDPGFVLTHEDLLATAYKESSNYSTEGLPGAIDVSFGFLRANGGDPYDYEMRFYESHQAAIDQGTVMAIEGTGADAILSEDDATYKAGIKNRRTIIGGGVGGGARSGIGPKFADYAIFGNIVMLCQGSDPETSLERCKFMADALVPGE